MSRLTGHRWGDSCILVPVDVAPLQADLSAGLARAGVPAHPIVVMTPWSIGAVSAYLFPGPPVTLIDAGVNTPQAWSAIQDALDAIGASPQDVERVIVTHAHTDHFGGAVLLQEVSGCDVLLHPADIAISDPSSWPESNRELFVPLGFTEEMIAAFWGDSDESFEWRAPDFVPVEDGTVIEAGEARLRVEHHPGHSPGHLWVVEEGTGAIFVGDYLIADHPTNAGLEVDRAHPSGRAQLLQAYNAGLAELASRTAPALFPAHGPCITSHAELIERRLAKTDRRTRHVLDALEDHPRSALDVGRRLYGSRVENSWEIMSDLVGRLDLLVATGHATVALGEDGVWYFRT